MRNSMDVSGPRESFMDAMTSALAAPSGGAGSWAAPPPAAAPAAPWASAPTLQTPACEPPLILKSSSAAVLPVAAATDEALIPDGFLSDAAAFGKSSSGPLGLQLKKSASLLNLINSVLGSSDNLTGLAAMMC